MVNRCDLFSTLLDLAGARPTAEFTRRINSPGKTYLSHICGKPESEWRKESERYVKPILFEALCGVSLSG